MKNINTKTLAMIFNIIALLSISFNGVHGQSDTDASIFFADLSNVSLDGIIDTSDTEYPVTYVISNSAELEFVELSWAHNSTHLAVGISANVKGWVGFGINDLGGGMLGSNMVIASFSNGTSNINDFHAVGNSEPILDADQYKELELAVASEDDTSTIVEFIIPMDSADTGDDPAGQDSVLEIGNSYSFFIAGHESSDTLIQHSSRTHVLSFTVESEDVAPPLDRLLVLGEEVTTLLIPTEWWIIIAFFGTLGIVIIRNSTLVYR